MRKIKISAVQYAINPIKSFDDFAAQVTQGVEKARGSDFVVFPELFTLQLITTFPGFQNFPLSDLDKITEYTDRYMDLFQRLSVENKIYIIAGSHLRKGGVHNHNTCHVFGPDGTLFQHQKSHLFPVERGINIHEGNSLEVLELENVKLGVAICYEAEIPECTRILSLKGAEIVFCPSFTFSEHGFWRVRHCCQARCIENQIYMVHCCTIGDLNIPGLVGWGQSSILSPCDDPWTANGVVAEAEVNKEMVVTGEVDLDEIYVNREEGAAPTFRDRGRRAEMYEWLYRRPVGLE
jgi:predicted amidohydrolase